MFFTNGALLAAMLPRYPEIKAGYALSDARFGLLVIAMPVGAVLAGAMAAPLIRRVGARVITGVGTVVLAVLFALVVGSPTPVLFAVGLALAGFTDAIVDSAQNVQGVMVEQWRGRSIINSLHAIWSLGATTGGVVGAWGAANGVDLQRQMIVNGVVWALVGVAAAILAHVPAGARVVTPPADGGGNAVTSTNQADATAQGTTGYDVAPSAEGGGPSLETDRYVSGAAGDDGSPSGAQPERTPTSSTAGQSRTNCEAHVTGGARVAGRNLGPWYFILLLSLLAISGTLIEEIGNSWSALFMLTETDAPASWVGLGYTVMLASQFVGRMLGDPMVNRWGTAAVARAGGVIITAGVLLLMVGPHHLVTLAGFGALGFGCATLVPAAFAASARVSGLPHGTGISVVGWLMRLGFLVGSPVVGLVSDATSLRVAMLIPLGAGITATLIAHRYLPRVLADARA